MVAEFAPATSHPPRGVAALRLESANGRPDDRGIRRRTLSTPTAFWRFVPTTPRLSTFAPPTYSNNVASDCADLTGTGVTEVDVERFLTSTFPLLYNTFLEQCVATSQTTFPKVSSSRQNRIYLHDFPRPRWPKKGWQNLRLEALELEIDDEQNGNILHELWTQTFWPKKHPIYGSRPQNLASFPVLVESGERQFEWRYCLGGSWRIKELICTENATWFPKGIKVTLGNPPPPPLYRRSLDDFATTVGFRTRIRRLSFLRREELFDPPQDLNTTIYVPLRKETSTSRA